MSTRFGSSTIPGLPSHFATSCARMPSVWRGKTGCRSSSCASATCERKTGSSRSSPSGAIIRGWYAFVGDGALLDLQTLAQQEHRQDLPVARRRQVPALLLLFHRRRVGTGLRAGADLAAVPTAGLLQRTQLAGQRVKIDFQLLDNALVEIADWERAQQI